MQNTKNKKDEQVERFLEECKFISYGKIELEIADGVPFKITKGVQTLRLDIQKNLTKDSNVE